jgi:hypothetical protein
MPLVAVFRELITVMGHEQLGALKVTHTLEFVQ